MSSLPLFDRPPSRRGSQTSQSAAQTMEPHAGRLRDRVLAFIENRGGQGATDEELHAAIGGQADTVRVRRIELRDAALVKDSGRRRGTASGCTATVWVATSQLPTPNSQPAISSNERGSRSEGARAGTGDRSPAQPARAPGPGAGAPTIAATDPPSAFRLPPSPGVHRIPDRCPRCKGVEFRDVPIHGGQSTRRDCCRCGLAIGFPIWHGQPQGPGGAAA